MRDLRKAALAAALSSVVTACAAAPPEANEGEEDLATSEGEILAAPSAIPHLGVDLTTTTVSGLSSGAFMAVQMHVAHARIVRGAAVFAGGPFLCAGGDVSTALGACMKPKDGDAPPDAALAVTRVRALAASGLVDDPAELANARVLLYGGAVDATVAPSVMESTRAFYASLVPGARIDVRLRVPGTGHVFPTLASGDACDAPSETYLGRCNVDGAALALGQLLGPLAPPSSKPKGRFVRFDQWRHGLSAAGLAQTGYVYVPTSCGHASARCRVHVAFHGCKQYAEGPVGERFVRESGYARWADTNRLVVVFPQISPSMLNPNGCWDWWGYTGPLYATKLAPQIAAVRSMLDALAEDGS